MSVYEALRLQYVKAGAPEDIDTYIRAHLEGDGFVFKRPDFFVMGRPVIRAALPAHIHSPWHHFSWEDCDAWFIFGFAGNMARLYQVLPWELPYVGWARLHDPSSELRFTPIAVLRRLCPPDLNAANL